MRAVDRNDVAPPAALTRQGGRGEKELEEVRAYRSNKKTAEKSFKFAAYKDATVKTALESLFHGKCAYCESHYGAQAPVDIEHFRPKGEVEGEPDHQGYWWIAMKWDNLLPSCIDCNRRRKQLTPKDPPASLGELYKSATKIFNTGKKDAFPIGGKRALKETDDLTGEQAHLLDPTRDNPDGFLEFYIDPDHLLGLVLPRSAANSPALLPALAPHGVIATAAQTAGVSVRGAVSIQVYGLNRLGLVQARTRVLRHLEFLRHMVNEIDSVARSLEQRQQKSQDRELRAAISTLDKMIDRILQEITEMARPEAPYSALVLHWKRRFLQDIGTP